MKCENHISRCKWPTGTIIIGNIIVTFIWTSVGFCYHEYNSFNKREVVKDKLNVYNI
jgi:hypothetical protein